MPVRFGSFISLNTLNELIAEGFSGLPRVSTDGVVEFAAPLRWSVEYRKIPCLAVWVKTRALGEDTGKPDLEYTLKLGHLDPIDTTTGVLARLHNLGYRCAASGEETEFDTDAVCAFRQDYGLAEGEQIDDAFRQRLIQEHDGG